MTHICSGPPQVGQHGFQPLLLDAGQPDDKFLAAETKQAVGSTCVLPEQLGALRQHRIAHAVAVAIVDPLEVIEIQHDHHIGHAGAGSGGDRVFQRDIHRAAVPYSRQWIEGGQALQLQSLAFVAHGEEIRAGAQQ